MMSKTIPAVIVVAGAALLAGCAAPTSLIDKTRFARPASVAIVDPPPMRNHALVGVYVLPNWYAHPLHFSPKFDHYFVAQQAAEVPGAAVAKASASEVALAQIQHNPALQGISPAAAGVGGAVGGLLQAGEELSAKRAMEYDQDLRKRMPDFDLRRDIVQSLASALRDRGVKVTLIANTGTTGPRLRWPAKGREGLAEVGSPDAPAVDADLVIQLSPVAHWFAPGLMNNFERTGNIGVVIHDGRSKEFLGSQSFFYDSPAFQNQYTLYTSLAADAEGATSAMRSGMLTMVPQIADAILGPASPAPAR